ncbi:MAG: RNA-directed DNA polymerase [Bacteroidetes bacterium]|nr:RNA-directed DNA polymerase [Bacteroidota bacterium]
MQIVDLLSKGYFPEELPPPFTTEDLPGVWPIIDPVLDTLDPISKKKKKVLSKIVTFSVPKVKAYRRNLGIPNPLHYIRLSNTIIVNWVAIVTHCSTSDISLSPLRIKAGSARALVKSSFRNIKRDKILRSTGRRFLLKVDIAKFYSSIYTHSIPWALHTKPVSKASYDRLLYFGNALDEDCRKMQDGQTVGVPIGPDTSRIISEIILSSIDTELKRQIGYLDGVRVVDDYHLYFKSATDLEKARATMIRVLKDFELELNQNKEELLPLPEIIDKEWFIAIRDYRFGIGWEKQRESLITFFDLTVRFSRKYPEDHVLTYAMSKLSFIVFGKRNWKILQSLLLNTLLAEPKILPYVAQNLLSYNESGHPVDHNLVKSALEELIVYHSDLGNDYEIAWSVWLARSLSVTLSELIGQTLSKNLNPIVILVTLDLHDKGFLPAGLDKTAWETLLTAENLYSEYWLVAYEAKKKGWLTSAKSYIATDAFFEILDRNDVFFYKDSRSLDLSKIKISALPGYFDDDEDEDDDDTEPQSIYKSVEVIPPPQPPAFDMDFDLGDDDLQF